jgi:hypothetical protein
MELLARAARQELAGSQDKAMQTYALALAATPNWLGEARSVLEKLNDYRNSDRPDQNPD